MVQLDNKKKQDINIRKDETKFILCGSDKSIYIYIFIYIANTNRKSKKILETNSIRW